MCKHSAGYNIMELHVSVIILCVVSIGTFATVNGQVDVRLSGGQTPFEGRVEVRRNNGEWIFICAMNTQQWNLMEARTVCKQLGFVDVMWLWKNSEFGVSVLPVSACNISCDVSSTSLDDCTIYWIDSCTCTAMYQAGVTCYFPGFRGRYKEKDPMRVFPVSTKKEIPASEVNIPTCINICREQGKSIAVLSSADECYCGDENTEYWRYGEAIPGEMINEYTEYGSQQCSGDTGTDPYKQACAGDWQFDVYDTYIGACGGDYTTDTGYIYSPNFPGLYPPNHSCIWTITVSDNNIIELSILMMKLSSGDFLTIRDGNVHSTILLNYTGINSYEGVLTVNSSSNALWLQFFSNHSSTDKGFVIAYQDTSLQLCTTPTVTDHLIISSAHHSDIFNHGDVITFTCKSGYGLIGERLISCQDDGQWSNNIPTCTAVSCGVPPSFSNAYHTHTDYTYPNTVYYQCVDGYYHSGSDTPNKQCMDTSSWSVGIEPQCTAVSCGVPPSFSNAYHTNIDYTYPNTVYYQCVDGYYHSGSGAPYKQCMDTSSWSVGIEPQCSAIPTKTVVTYTPTSFHSKIHRESTAYSFEYSTETEKTNTSDISDKFNLSCTMCAGFCEGIYNPKRYKNLGNTSNDILAVSTVLSFLLGASVTFFAQYLCRKLRNRTTNYDIDPATQINLEEDNYTSLNLTGISIDVYQSLNNRPMYQNEPETQESGISDYEEVPNTK